MELVSLVHAKLDGWEILALTRTSVFPPLVNMAEIVQIYQTHSCVPVRLNGMAHVAKLTSMSVNVIKTFVHMVAHARTSQEAIGVTALLHGPELPV